jgi:hypothetical protein
MMKSCAQNKKIYIFVALTIFLVQCWHILFIMRLLNRQIFEISRNKLFFGVFYIGHVRVKVS